MKTLLFSTAIVLTALLGLSGCKEEPTQPAEQNGAAETTDHQHQPADAVPDASSTAGTEQTICPVMGGAIDKDIFVEYQGKKVYFCCAACKPEFEKNPEKYLSKLPQFKGAQ